MPFTLFVASRYLRTKRRGLFTMITTIIGVTGVSIGVAALLTTLSVMNGFQADIQKKIVGAQAHVTVHARMNPEREERLREAIAAESEIVATSPFVLGQGIVTFGERSTGIVLKGVDPRQEFTVNDLSKSLTAGDWANLEARPVETGGQRSAVPEGGKPVPGIVIGEELAKNLGAWIGDEVILISPQSLSTPMGMIPAMKKFRVVGTLHTGYYEYDSAAGYAELEPVAKFFKTPGGLSGIQAKVSDLELADAVSASLQDRLGWDYRVRSFTEMNRTLFAALKLEKAVMFIILALIILVASFNIASNLVLMGNEKLRDIGLLKAMGATHGQIRGVFLWVGSLIGGFGVLLGVLLGLILCWIIERYPIVELPPDIYYLSRVPVAIEPLDVVWVVVCGLALAVLATIYPAYKTSKVDPIEAIHYG
jgi:lipoprotein-releasing system permease protein